MAEVFLARLEKTDNLRQTILTAMIYALLKPFFRFALNIFFKKIYIRNRHLAQQTGPLVIVSNHPSTLMDPLIIGILMQQQLYFLAKSTLFGKGLRAYIARKLHMIPVFRKQDFPEGGSDNDQMFQQCFSFLAQKGTLLIFPEGTSLLEKRLREIKTGAARIALGAESNNNFALGVKILTIGLNYSNAQQFRSKVYIHLEEPIQVSDYRKIWEEDHFRAVGQLTDDIRKKLEKSLIITLNDKHDVLTKHIEELFGQQLLEESAKDAPKPEKAFWITQNIALALGYMEENHPEALQQTTEKLETYLEQLEELKLKDAFIQNAADSRLRIWDALNQLAFLFVGFPFFLLGGLTSYIPYRLPGLLAPIISKDLAYRGPLMLIIGIFSFSTAYLLQTWLFSLWLSSWIWGVCFFAALPFFGFFALGYWRYFKQIKGKIRLLALFYSRKAVVNELIHQRKEITEIFETMKLDYLDWKAKGNIK